MITQQELRDWLRTLPKNAMIGIDDSGLTLMAVTPETAQKCIENGNAQAWNYDAPYIDMGGIQVEE